MRFFTINWKFKLRFSHNGPLIIKFLFIAGTRTASARLHGVVECFVLKHESLVRDMPELNFFRLVFCKFIFL